MKTYVLTMYQPDEGTPPPEVLEPVMAELGRLREEMQAAGGWVFGGGLHPASSATVVRPSESQTLVTDGPYVEGTEHIGGFTVVRAPDLDVVLGWARRMAAVTGLPVEVRSFAG